MAIYHLSARVVSRSKGQSAVHKAAYNARTQLEDERLGRKTRNYQDEGGIVFSGIFAPKGAPAWAQDRAQLWNRVEAAEKRKDAQVAREIEIALPHELTDQQREWLVKDFVREQFVRKGMIADVAIHAPNPKGDERNYHAHILLTLRELKGKEFAGTKNREWNSKETLQGWREAWSRTVNRSLERFGHGESIDHRSLKEQGIDREPTIHLGPNAAAMEARGIGTERGEQLRGIETRNRERASVKKELREMEGTERQFTVPSFPSGSGKELARAEQVVSGALDVFAAMAEKLLEGFANALAPPSPATVGEQRAARIRSKMGAEIAERKRSEALVRMAREHRSGKSMSPAELRFLSVADLQEVKDHGEAAVRTLILQHEEERRREHDRER